LSRTTLVDRLFRGTRWAWVAERHQPDLPRVEDLGAAVMGLDARDRLHSKQGRSTARVVFHGLHGPVPVYLKRHFRLPWPTRLAATVRSGGNRTPATAEWAHLERARALGIRVPEVVAVGERVGPWGRLQSFLIIAELTGSEALNEVLPRLRAALDPAAFARLKRELIAEMADIVARLHGARVFHKDLYLCHFYLDLTAQSAPGRRLTLIDLHRSGEHRLTPWRWRWKDLGQLLFSTEGVEGVDWHDLLRFWVAYRRKIRPTWADWQRRRIVTKAARYSEHNRRSAAGGER